MPPVIPSPPPNLTRVWSSATSTQQLPPPSDIAELLSTGNAAPSVAGRLIALSALSEHAPEYAAAQPLPPSDMPAWSDVIASAVFPSSLRSIPLAPSLSPFHAPATILTKLSMTDSLLQCDPTPATPMEIVLVGRHSSTVDTHNLSSYIPFTSTDDYELADGEQSHLQYKQALGIKSATPLKSPPISTSSPKPPRRKSKTAMPHPSQIMKLKDSAQKTAKFAAEKTPDLDNWKQRVLEMQASARKKMPQPAQEEEILEDTGYAKMTKIEQIRAKKREQSRIAREKRLAQEARRHEKMKKLAKRKKKMAKMKRGEPYVSESEEEESEPEVQEVIPSTPQPQLQSQPTPMQVDTSNANGNPPSQTRRSPRNHKQSHNYDTRSEQYGGNRGGPTSFPGNNYQPQTAYSGERPRTPRDYGRQQHPRHPSGHTPPSYHSAPPHFPHDEPYNRDHRQEHGFPPPPDRYDNRMRAPPEPQWDSRPNYPPPNYDQRGRYPSPRTFSPRRHSNSPYPPQPPYPPVHYGAPPPGYDPRYTPDRHYSPHPAHGGPPPFFGGPEPPRERLSRQAFEQKRRELYEAIQHTMRDLRPEDSKVVDDFLDNQRNMFLPNEYEKDYLLEKRGHELTVLRIQKQDGMWKVVKLKSSR